MPTINVILKDGTIKQINAESGWSIMEILRNENLESIEGVCGGALACATCHIYIHPDWRDKVAKQGYDITEEEENTLDQAFDVNEYSRLGCQIRMNDDLDGIILAVAGAKINW